MANMKTLTVNGVTYTIDDPDAVSYGARQVLTEEQKQQARENIHAASLEQLDAAVRDTVDGTCPSFSESGTMVTCEPVEGYPLTVTATPEDKNYLQDFWDAYDWDGSLYYLTLPPGQYRIWGEVDEDEADECQYLALKKSTDGGASWQIHGLVYDDAPSTLQEVSFTVTGDPNEQWAIENGENGYYGGLGGQLYVFRRLEINRVAAQITRCGKNLYKPGVPSASKSGVTFTVNADGSVTANGTAEANTYFAVGGITLPVGEYVLSGCPAGGSIGTHTLFLQAGDKNIYNRSEEAVFTNTDSAERYSMYIYIALGQTVSNLIFYPMVRPVGTAGGYEPHAAGTFAPGDTIPALPGVNTVYADAGLVTVTGRANPAAIINDLQTRLAAIEAAIVNNTENTEEE